jgi:hypothetical protein
MTGEQWGQGVAGLAFCTALYAWNYWGRDRVSDWLVPYTRLTRRMPRRSAQLVARIPFYGLPGIAVYSVLRPLFPGQVLPLRPSVTAVGAGLLLGCALMMAGSALANGVFVAAHAAGPGRQRADARTEMRAAKDSGWIRSYTLAYRSLPWWMFLLLTVISVTGEELMFRGVIMPLTVHGFGFWPGYLLTLAAFVGIQKMFMPSWRGALVPMSGALVVGAVLGYLGLHGSGIVLLISTHAGFFLTTTLVLLAQPRRSLREQAIPGPVTDSDAPRSAGPADATRDGGTPEPLPGLTRRR